MLLKELNTVDLYKNIFMAVIDSLFADKGRAYP